MPRNKLDLCLLVPVAVFTMLVWFAAAVGTLIYLGILPDGTIGFFLK